MRTILIILQTKKDCNIFILQSFFDPSGWRDSNSRPPAPHAGTLPTALHPDLGFTLSVAFYKKQAQM